MTPGANDMTPAQIAQVNMDPGVTPLQGRVVFHQERLFRSTGGGLKACLRYQAEAIREGLPTLIGLMSPAECKRALWLIERACRLEGMQLFRDVRTGWEKLPIPYDGVANRAQYEAECAHAEQAAQ